MSPKLLKNIYITATLSLSLLIFIPISLNTGLEMKWWYTVILFFISSYIGKFLFVYFSGINIFELQFIEQSIFKQEFRMYIYLGINKIIIDGEFNNNIGIKENDLKLLIYNQTTRHMLDDIIKNGGQKEIKYNYQDTKLIVKFIK